MFCVLGIAVALFAQGKGPKQTQQTNRSNDAQDAPGTQRPDVVRMIGPVRQDQDVRNLPYVAPKAEFEERRLTRYPHTQPGGPPPLPPSSPWLQNLMKGIFRPAPKMPGPLLTFEGTGDLCGCQPSDSEGDVGPNHYVEAINESIKIFDKNGNTLAGPISYNSFFSGLTGTPCTSANDGDPYVIYDKQADRWLINDFAFPSFPGSSFYQCIAVSQTNDPVSGGWFLYALQVDPANPTFLGDYPKFAVWNDGGTQNAYFLTMNLFSSPTTFNGVRAYALDRASMLTGEPPNAIGFTLNAADVGASYSFVAASFRTGDPPPAGRNEMVLAIDSPASGGVTLTQVHARFFHVDFANPANATFGVGANHAPNAEITVNGFVDAFTNTTSDLVPQQGTATRLDTLGDKIMTPVVYHNHGGTESLWADSTVCTDANCTGPTGVRWYQFDVTGGNLPATPVQQQTWTNTTDGLWRWMPSIAVDQSGNTVIGYSTSSTTIFPSIRYAGRLESDPPSNMGQGEAIMFAGVTAQTSGSRWGDYTRTEVDPSDGMSFWHINQYAQSGDWHTRIGKFNFQGGGGTPTPTPTPTATPTPSATPRPSPTPTPPIASPYDFNHDNKPDFVLYNGSTRQTAVWYMHNNVSAGGASGPILPAGWSLIDVADFDRDGNNDYALFNSSTRQTAIWYLSGVTLVGGAFGPTLPSGWTLVATGDFNGDGKPDYVLFNASTRQTALWYLNNNVYIGGALGPTLPVRWRLAGVADFNGNGKTDYALFNSSKSQTAIWYLSGPTIVGGAFGPTLPNGWALVATADFNGDGKPDYVVYRASSRQTGIVYMNNNVAIGAAFGPTLPPGWSLVAP